MRIAFIGAGRLGGALAFALSECGFEIAALVARNVSPAQEIARRITPPPPVFAADRLAEIRADVIFITTRDAEIAAAAHLLRENLTAPAIVFHASGALSSEILRDLKNNGCAVGSLHPLISVSDWRRGAEQFAGAYFCVEGDAEAVAVGEEFVRQLGGKSFAVPTAYKTLYHAAAVMACGHLIALLDAAIEMLTTCGLPPDEARKVLLPLIKSTVGNLATQTAAESLTGTFARADVPTFENHLATLRENASTEILEIYLLLAARSIPLAAEQGASAERLREISDKLLLAKKNLKW